MTRPARRVAVRVALIGTAATAIAALSATAPAYGIANGEDAPEGAYPFAVALSMPKIVRGDGTSYASACSGALIAPTWIITAGHCFHDGDRNRVSGAPRYRVEATVGQDTLSGDDGTTIGVVDVVQHPDTDVALAELAEPVPDVEPLPIGTEAPEAGDDLRLVGWGATDANTDPAQRPDHLQTGEFTVTRVADTRMFVEATGPDTLTSACPFDSGAPYFREGDDGPELVATEITGPSCPHSSEEMTARSDVLTDWISEHVGADLRPAID